MTDTSDIIQDLERQVRQRVGRQIRDLSVQWRSDGVLLQGCAPSYYVKQLAQQVIIDHATVRLVANEIEVR